MSFSPKFEFGYDKIMKCKREMISTNFLNDNKCVNNKQIIWIFNQGVILSGLALLYNATWNSTLIDIAQNTADSTIEPSTYSNEIFARHLGYLLQYLTDTYYVQKYTLFLQKSAVLLLTTNQCELDDLFDLFWSNDSSNSCNLPRNTASTSRAFDLFLFVSKIKRQIPSSNWILPSLGNYMYDDKNLSMANFYKNDFNKAICRTTVNKDNDSVAYDYQLKCNGIGFYRIRK
ncbi:unnamed protein product [Rotaria sp. Silwood2]|nr:unnamed protein product [Rotaria sp. Silwood2]CAF2806308.1 unnamed protein product [Rotaria sp. Silwood2]